MNKGKTFKIAACLSIGIILAAADWSPERGLLRLPGK
jgi:hypothetical protein